MTRQMLEHDEAEQPTRTVVARRGLLRAGGGAMAAGAVAVAAVAASVMPAAADDAEAPGAFGICVDDYGATGDGETDDRAAIQNAINAGTAAGVPVWFTAGKTYVSSSFLSVTGPATISGYGATLRDTGGANAIRILGSSVTIEGLTIVGNGGETYTGGMRGIQSNGTAEEPCVGCHVRDVKVQDMGEDTTPQTYGISVTDRVNTVEGRASDVTVSNCLVKNVADWTALSTHGGERITFAHNRVIGCHRGIIYGAGDPTRVVTATDGLAIGNIVDGTGAGGSVGMAVIGQSTGAASTAFKSGNLVQNHDRLFEATTNGVWLDEE